MKLNINDKFFSKECLKNTLKININNAGYSKIINKFLCSLNIIDNYKNVFSYLNTKYSTSVISNLEIDEYEKYNNEKINITLCAIVKNEERCIKRFLDKHLPYFDEIVIVDTGSTDNTLNILKSYKAVNKKLNTFDYIWEDDFSKVRNFAKKNAKNEWILFLDADEYIKESEINKLYDLLKIIDFHENKKEFAFSLEIQNKDSNIRNITMQRIINNSKYLNYYGRVHEYVKSTSKNGQFALCHTNIVVFHDGYMNGIIKKKDKVNRNLELLRKMIEEDTSNFRWLYYFTRDIIYNPNLEEISYITENYLPKIKKQFNKEYSKEVIVNIIAIYFQCGQFELVDKLIQEYEELEKDNYDFVYYKTLLHYIECKNKMNYLLKEICKYRKKTFNKMESRINYDGYHIDLLIGLLLFEIGKFDQARKYIEFIDNKIDDDLLFVDIEPIKQLLNIQDS